jgi:triacylglycerol lipase
VRPWLQGPEPPGGNLSPLLLYRRARRELRHLRGYLDFARSGNQVERRCNFDRCQHPVLLLYGFFATRRSLEVLERRLRRDGYCVFSLNLGGLVRAFNTRGIDDLAELVRTKVDRLYARHPLMGPLTMVGHSKGGLVAAYYVKRLGGHRRTRAVVTLGTPHRGTPAAWIGLPLWLFARSVRQMTPRSPFLLRLQQGEWPAHVRLASLWSRQDRLAPYPTALLEERRSAQVRNVEVRGTHRDFLLKKRIYDSLLAEIRAAEAAARPGLTLVRSAS